MLGWEFDGMRLHEYYFDNLGGTKKALDANDPLQQQMVADFGGYDQWKSDFVATGVIRGIGWVVTYMDPNQGRLVNVWINEHDLGHLAGATPLLVMDVFEHAYITQFGIDRPKYIEVFFNNINWDVIAALSKKGLSVETLAALGGKPIFERSCEEKWVRPRAKEKELVAQLHRSG